MPLTEQTYRAVVLEDPEGQWELFRGRLREKPGMTAGHNRVGDRLVWQLHDQLDRREFDVRSNAARLRRSDETYFIPDVLVLPRSTVDRIVDRIDMLEAYDGPVPFVAEVWSPSTGAYDVDTKFAEYRRRGDAEIWRLHPLERTVRVWRRQPDGSYVETLHQHGRLQLRALPLVTIDLDELFGEIARFHPPMLP